MASVAPKEGDGSGSGSGRAVGGTRLERLLALLDSGSNPATRKAAAIQLGDLAKTHASEIQALINRVHPYLHSKNWDTRVAASQAILAIAENVKHPSVPNLLYLAKSFRESSYPISDFNVLKSYDKPTNPDNFLSFRSLDITQVLENGTLLVASEGQEFDDMMDYSGNDIERIGKQKLNLKKRLGLGGCEQFMDLNDLINDEDLMISSTKNNSRKQHPLSFHKVDFDLNVSMEEEKETLTSQTDEIGNKFRRTELRKEDRRGKEEALDRSLSARERNLLKRKSKAGKGVQFPSTSEESEDIQKGKKRKILMSSTPEINYQKISNSNFQAELDIFDKEEEGEWKLKNFYEKLLINIFHPKWEIRHGCLMALREILTVQGTKIGVKIPKDKLVNIEELCFSSKNLFNELDLVKEFDQNLKCVIDPEGTNSVFYPSQTGVSEINKSVRFGDLTIKLEPPDFHPSQLGKLGTSNDSLGNKDTNFHPNEKTGFMEKDFSRAHSGVGDDKIVSDSQKGIIKNEKMKLEFDLNTNESQFHASDLKVEAKFGGATQQVKDVTKLEIKRDIDEQKEVNQDVSPDPFEKKNNESRISQTDLCEIALQSFKENMKILEDCIIKLLCILSLDRFGDFIGDQVVAPVRENCAQTLGVAIKYLPLSLVHSTLNVLLLMQNRPEWEVRHGSMLGIKYIVAVRQDLTEEIFPNIIPSCMQCLIDSDDDVRAVAADALKPISRFITRKGQKFLRKLLSLLWDVLMDLDDLSPSTASVMNLLSELYGQPDFISEEGKQPNYISNRSTNEVMGFDSEGENYFSSLEFLIPRLWPLFRHNIHSVRLAAVKTLERLFEIGFKKNDEESKRWMTAIISHAMSFVFQNFLLECESDVLLHSHNVWNLLLRCETEKLLDCTSRHLARFFLLSSTIPKSTMNSNLLFFNGPDLEQFLSSPSTKSKSLARNPAKFISKSKSKVQFSDASFGSSEEPVYVSEPAGMVSRMAIAKSLGDLVFHLPIEKCQIFIDQILSLLNSNTGSQRQLASLIIIYWFRNFHSLPPHAPPASSPLFDHLSSVILNLLSATNPSFPTPNHAGPYTELVRTYAKLRNEASSLWNHAESANVSIDEKFPPLDSFLIGDAVRLANHLEVKISKSLKLVGNIKGFQENTGEELIETFRQRVLTTAGYLKIIENNLHTSVMSSLACAAVWVHIFPSKLNPLIQPLMASIRKESEELLQKISAEALSELISHCMSRKPNPVDKLVKNICTLCCMEVDETDLEKSTPINEGHETNQDPNSRKAKSEKEDMATEKDKAEKIIAIRGGKLTLKALSDKFKANLFKELPKLWNLMNEAFDSIISAEQIVHFDWVNASLPQLKTDTQVIIESLRIIDSVIHVMDQKLLSELLRLFPSILSSLCHVSTLVRSSAAACIASLAQIDASKTTSIALSKIIPMLQNPTCVNSRLGASSAIFCMIESQKGQNNIIAFSSFLVVPLLKRMNDPCEEVRKKVMKSFALLVPLLPLAKGLDLSEMIDSSLIQSVERDNRFLEQLLDNKSVDDYELKFKLCVKLRRYQQEGINWLAFLKKFHLHGILCDDMGLGKTLQTSVMLASDVLEQLDEKNTISHQEKTFLPSLVVCPTTLVSHWLFEIEKFIPNHILKPMKYVGNTQDRNQVWDKRNHYNVIITSYEVLRSDVELFEPIFWSYCVLDEGHIIKNAKSKIARSVKRIKADHRLILSGTPIQNSVLELWSLFDFLMPGFLGTEKQFQATYGKPLIASKDPKCTSKQMESGVLAMEALHKQVMPFLLRRTKEQVLQDLPPKIIQDRYCELSPLQMLLYEDFAKSQTKNQVDEILQTYGKSDTEEIQDNPRSASSHIFQALQYLRKLCSHPLLILDMENSKHKSAVMNSLNFIPEEFKKPSTTSSSDSISAYLHDIYHSPKLLALKEILEECGIGNNYSVTRENNISDDNVESASNHRVLIFAQLKSFLDIIENDLFRVHMPNVAYLRLDGSVESNRRFEVVKKFNSDPTIDVLLLTTHVGGLGLNLTSADTVILIEHDWNPMRDLQAMDRAHRLGQKRIVNVHRLITKNTLEEKLMSLQKFKVNVAESVVNAENASLNSMDTTQLLDLFSLPPNMIQKQEAMAESMVQLESASMIDGSDLERKLGGRKEKKGLKAVLGSLEELWDDSQYAEEYNLDSFISRLNS